MRPERPDLAPVGKEILFLVEKSGEEREKSDIFFVSQGKALDVLIACP